MNQFEIFFFNLLNSYFWSKLLPYLISVLIGCLAFYLLFKKLGHKKQWVRLSISILALTLPFICYFLYQPIYEGDFSNNYNIVETKNLDLKQNQLTIITIPGCPYCAAAVQEWSKISFENKLELQIKICSSDSSSIPEYRQLSKENPNINISLVDNLDKWATISKGTYPSFLCLKKNLTYCWSNDNFGVSAKDFILK